MFRIAVCDDDRLFAESLKELIRDLMRSKKIAYEVEAYHTLSALDMELQAQSYDLLFLDVLVKDSSGIRFACRLREHGNNVNVVFVSGNREYALEAYSAFPVSFLEKPISKQDLQAVLDRVFSAYTQKPCVIVNDKDRGKTLVQQEAICYIESQGHDILVQLKDKDNLLFGGVFSEFIKDFPTELFFRCHRSYAVNMQCVHRLQNYQFVMKDGSIIPISKPLFKEAQERFVSIIKT